MNGEDKKHVWDDLLEIKHDRTIVVSTQSYEEADILGDRIALMADGEIHGCGKPAFLKQKLGSGYHLQVQKGANFDLDGLKSLLTQYVSAATCENGSLKEVSFNLGAADVLGDFFDELDSRKTDLGIISYNVSLSTIKDVLLTVSNKTHKEQNFPTSDTVDTTSSETGDVSRDSALNARTVHQFLALLLKQFHYSKNRWRFHIIQLAVPFAMMLICMCCFHFTLKSQEPPPLQLDIGGVYGSTDGFYYHTDDPPSLSNLAETFKKVLESNKVSVERVSEPTHYVLNYAKKGLAKYFKDLVVGGTISSFASGSLNLTAWHNLGAAQSMPMSLLLMQTALLRHVANTGSMSLAIVPVIPLKEKFFVMNKIGFVAASWADLFVPTAFTFLSLSMILIPARERTTRLKLLQLMSGVRTELYWIATFVWDFWIYIVACILTILPPAIFYPSVFHWKAIGTFLLFLILYGWASLPLGYIVSILLNRENRGLTIFIGISVLFSTVISYSLAYISSLLFLREYKFPYGLTDADWFFRLFPTSSFASATRLTFLIALHNSVCNLFSAEDLAACNSPSLSTLSTLSLCCKDKCTKDNCYKNLDYISWSNLEPSPSIGPYALFLGVEGVVFFAILLLLETRTAEAIRNVINVRLQRSWNLMTQRLLRRGPGHQILIESGTTEDPQVLREEERIRNLTATQQGSAGDNALVVLELRKKCETSASGNSLTFGVDREECFGILGVNGAGKTSTFRMLAGDDLPSEGNAFLQNCSLKGDLKKFQSSLGYCPEVDPLVEDLTGREMLLHFGQLRGLFGHELLNRVNESIRSMELTSCANERTQFYSGGERRKLSVAMALIGSPPVILLDEPTSRVDPASRRLIWSALSRARKRTGAAVLLATQSMEESTTLCNRLAVMENGRFSSLHSLEQPKSAQGQGYALTLKMSKDRQSSSETVNTLKNHIQNSLKNATLTYDYQGMLRYHVTSASPTVGHLFRFMSEAKAQFLLEDYSLGTLPLEQACSRT